MRRDERYLCILYVYHTNIQTFHVELVRPLIKIGDAPPLEFMAHCVVIPPNINPEHPSEVFEDGVEEEAFQRRGMFNSHFDEIHHYLIFVF